ncbi:VRR-NUC domain-containing protein [Earliella scabrosa]|nr:VRR-NUC domain-containing protein [Earliella scabrosa]
MTLRSPSASFAAKVVYDSGVDAEFPASGSTVDSSSEDNPFTEDTEEEDIKDDEGKSMYVTLFEDMIKVVLDKEPCLFVEEELQCFMAWHRLPYNAKYLFCRLALRKDKWHRLDMLNYEKELGSDGIRSAIETLCRRAEPEDIKPKVEELDEIPVKLFKDDVKPKLEPEEPQLPLAPEKEVKQNGPEVIDLTLDEEDEQPQAGPSRLSPVYEPPPPVFADDEDAATLLELLDCLRGPELDALAKQFKLKRTIKKREVLIEMLLRGSANQTTLSYLKTSKKGKEPMKQPPLQFGVKKPPLRQGTLPFKPTPQSVETQQERLRAMVIGKLTKCIRLNAHVVALFRRVDLVYFRRTQYAVNLITPAILARAKKRTYASYLYIRTPNIWRSREELIAYEEALALEAEVDALLDGPGWNSGSGQKGRSTMSCTPAPMSRKTPVTPGKGKGKAGSPVVLKGAVKMEDDEPDRLKNARKVKEILDRVFPTWQDLVAATSEADPERKSLERFECGHILTRVVCKGAHALGILKEYHQEVKVLEALLGQRRWRRGRRGRWYERRALVLMHHLKHEPGRMQEAMAVVVNALTDTDTHMIYRPKLVSRLTTLEKRLNVPLENRHRCKGSLEAATDVLAEGVRIYHRADSLVLDKGRVANQSPVKTQASSRLDDKSATSPVKVKQEKNPQKAGVKSIWQGLDGKEVSVEEYALQWYQEQDDGCRGSVGLLPDVDVGLQLTSATTVYLRYHCEGRIVTTLFGLLFWDVIFAPMPGAFETPYQAAPLDLVEDTFYYSRQELADARLAEIEAGKAAEIVEKTYDEQKDVMCVGVRWDMFTKEDLIGIAKCLQPNALVAICQLMCEDYAARTAGVPDLIIWNEEKGYAKFVEVKGPGDHLQENQKVWVDVLLQAGMPVELCHVHEPGQKPKLKRTGKTPKKEKGTAGRKRKRRADDWLAESEDEDEEEPDYSQLDRHSDEDEEEAQGPSPKKRRTRTQAQAAAEDVPQLPPEPVTPTRRRVEVVITSSPPRARTQSTSPRKRKRSEGD